MRVYLSLSLSLPHSLTPSLPPSLSLSTGRLDRLLVREVVGELLEGRLGELGLTVPQTCVSAMCVFSKSLHACVCSRVFAM